MGDAYTANTRCSHTSYLLKIKFHKQSIIMCTKTEGKSLYKISFQIKVDERQFSNRIFQYTDTSYFQA